LNGKKPVKVQDYLYWQFNEAGLKEALTRGDWKLIRFKEKGSAEKLELYNLKNDIGEQDDISIKNPKIVKALYALMKNAKTPSENPRFDWSDIEK